MPGLAVRDIKTAGIVFLSAYWAPLIGMALNGILYLFYLANLTSYGARFTPYGGLFITSVSILLLSSIACISWALTRGSMKAEKFSESSLWISIAAILTLPLGTVGIWFVIIWAADCVYAINSNIFTFFAYVIVGPIVIGQFITIIMAVYVCEILKLMHPLFIKKS